jgi:hypothetical protein
MRNMQRLILIADRVRHTLGGMKKPLVDDLYRNYLLSLGCR